MNKRVRTKPIQPIYLYPKNSSNLGRATGVRGESLARVFLERKGYAFLSANVHTHWGEIDLIMESPNRTTVFVEVKTKQSSRYGIPEDEFHYRKRVKLRRAIEWYCLKKHVGRYQVDLVAIQFMGGAAEIRHYQNVEM